MPPKKAAPKIEQKVEEPYIGVFIYYLIVNRNLEDERKVFELKERDRTGAIGAAERVRQAGLWIIGEVQSEYVPPHRILNIVIQKMEQNG